MANLKRNMIKLVKEVKEGEVITETYLTPVFIPFSVVYEAVDIQEDIDKNTLTEKELFDKMIDIVANKIYNKQFTIQDLLNGLHAPDAIQPLQEQVIFVSRGYQSDETKKYMEKKS
ncbi:phage tail assembly chaperone G [Peribacillus simplex]|uniref:phage tail assembly chaperone G n=1 Tax=Peribacillus simplex TaxID=1478 RepID=UPI00366EDB18